MIVGHVVKVGTPAFTPRPSSAPVIMNASMTMWGLGVEGMIEEAIWRSRHVIKERFPHHGAVYGGRYTSAGRWHVVWIKRGRHLPVHDTNQ